MNLEIGFSMGQPSVDLVTPCTLVLYQCGCADVLSDALVSMPSIETEYINLSRITNVEDGGPFADHTHDEHGGCRLTGPWGAVSAYWDFMRYHGLLERQRAA